MMRIDLVMGFSRFWLCKMKGTAQRPSNDSQLQARPRSHRGFVLALLPQFCDDNFKMGQAVMGCESIVSGNSDE
jgi:hypothetical protein